METNEAVLCKGIKDLQNPEQKKKEQFIFPLSFSLSLSQTLGSVASVVLSLSSSCTECKLEIYTEFISVYRTVLKLSTSVKLSTSTIPSYLRQLYQNYLRRQVIYVHCTKAIYTCLNAPNTITHQVSTNQPLFIFTRFLPTDIRCSNTTFHTILLNHA